MNLQIGQKVFIKKIGNAARYLDQKKAPIEEYVEEATISKIGRKWFKVEGRLWDNEQFSIATGWHDAGEYSSRYVVYESMQEIHDEIEAGKMLFWIRNQMGSIGHASISLKKLQLIKQILEQPDN